jgi:LAS superfamily LD-carboxypeptidase LdcB
MQLISPDQILGLDDAHVVALARDWCVGECALHPFAIAALGQLRQDARGAGFDLRVVSGFRSFARQAEIWNGKASGMRAVLDAAERPLDIAALDERELMFAILRWSALPGASRHHWGSDLDVLDAAAVGRGYALRLTVEETQGAGPFAPLHRWLDERIAAGRAHGFFRPYVGSGCEVAAEPWHLSFAPLAGQCEQAFDAAALCRAHRAAGLLLQRTIEACLDQVLRRFFRVPAELYTMALRSDELNEVIT